MNTRQEMFERPSSFVGTTVRHSPGPKVSRVEALGNKSAPLLVIHDLEGVFSATGIDTVVKSENAQKRRDSCHIAWAVNTWRIRNLRGKTELGARNFLDGGLVHVVMRER